MENDVENIKKRPRTDETDAELSNLVPSQRASKPRKKPKLDLSGIEMPKFIYDPETENSQREEEIKQHKGRIRTLPVLAGHWPTSVYLSVKLNIPNLSKLGFEAALREIPCLSSLFSAMSKSSTSWTFFNPNDLHISLSRTFSLRHHEIEPFNKELQDYISLEKRSGIFVDFDAWKILCNDQRTTSFSTLIVNQGKDQIVSLIEMLDKIMIKFGHEVYYKDPVVHASIAWTPSDLLPLLDESETLRNPISIPINTEAIINKVCCKVGKVIREWSLE